MPDSGGDLQPAPPEGQILIYQDGATRLQVRLEGRTVWLPQRLMADLFQVSVKTVNEHLLNIYDDGELDREATIRNFRIVQREGSRDVARNIEHYNLDAILAVGYRVRSARGTVFRQWATAQLRDLLVKGFVLDDQRLKEGRTLGGDYFDEPIHAPHISSPASRPARCRYTLPLPRTIGRALTRGGLWLHQWYDGELPRPGRTSTPLGLRASEGIGRALRSYGLGDARRR